MIKIMSKKENFQVVTGNYVLLDWNVYIIHQTEREMFSLINISTGKRYTDEKPASELRECIMKADGTVISNKDVNLTFEH